MGRSAADKARRARYRGPLPVGPFRDAILKINTTEDEEDAQLKAEIDRLRDKVEARKVCLDTARHFIEVVTGEEVGWPVFDDSEWFETGGEESLLMTWLLEGDDDIWVWAGLTGVKMSISIPENSPERHIIDPAKARELAKSWTVYLKDKK